MKVIRATLIVEVPYTNERMNNGTLLDEELRKTINNVDFLPAKVVVCEEDEKEKHPIIKQ